MDTVVRFLQDVDYQTIATDPRLMFVVGVVLVLAIIFRWKAVLLLFFAIGGVMAVMRYSGTAETPGGESFDKSLVIFVAGCILVGVVLIYFLFIRGD